MRQLRTPPYLQDENYFIEKRISVIENEAAKKKALEIPKSYWWLINTEYLCRLFFML